MESYNDLSANTSLRPKQVLKKYGLTEKVTDGKLYIYENICYWQTVLFDLIKRWIDYFLFGHYVA